MTSDITPITAASNGEDTAQRQATERPSTAWPCCAAEEVQGADRLGTGGAAGRDSQRGPRPCTRAMATTSDSRHTRSRAARPVGGGRWPAWSRPSTTGGMLGEQSSTKACPEPTRHRHRGRDPEPARCRAWRAPTLQPGQPHETHPETHRERGEWRDQRYQHQGGRSCVGRHAATTPAARELASPRSRSSWDAAFIVAKIGPIVAQIVHIALEVIRIAALTAGAVLAFAVAAWLAIMIARWWLRHHGARRQAILQPVDATAWRDMPGSRPADCLACGGSGKVLRPSAAAGISRAHARCVSPPSGRGDHDAAAVCPQPPQQPLHPGPGVRAGAPQRRRGASGGSAPRSWSW